MPEAVGVWLKHPRDVLAVSAARDAFLFDFDGTLVDIAPSPEAVTVPACLTAVLRTIGERSGGAVGIISGRSVGDLEALLPSLDIIIAGEYGTCILGPGARIPVDIEQPSFAVAALRRAFERIAAWAQSRPGLVVERKTHSVALHYRARPDLKETVRLFSTQLQAHLTPFILRQPGKMVEELRLVGPDKGDALKRLMGCPAFSHRRPLFFGDDLADEPAFRAAAERGGAGIFVGIPDRQTAAQAVLETPADLLHYLEETLCR
jgi:trehalose 6-phosphate phosphatase